MGSVKDALFTSNSMALLPTKRILLKDLNDVITCKLCQGYFIDATTITECLCTFCKSCIVKHLEDDTSCPTCGDQIHQSYPLNYIAHDRTMQDIVLKLVPHLLEDETERERTFYEERGLPNPKDELPEDEEDEEEEGANPEDAEGGGGGGKEDEHEGAEKEEVEEEEKEEEKPKFEFHREDEQVNLRLEPDDDSNLPELKKKFIRCSSQATVNHVKKYVALKLWNDVSRFKDLDIICDEKFCGKDHALKLVVISNWKCRPYPVELKYRPKDEFY